MKLFKRSKQSDWEKKLEQDERISLFIQRDKMFSALQELNDLLGRKKGQKEVFFDGKNGYLFLFTKTISEENGQRPEVTCMSLNY